MNQRIRQLALHAGMKECALGFGMPENVLWGDDQIKNFAELLVQECADIAKHHVMNISTYADADFVDEQIKQHFGVEQ